MLWIETSRRACPGLVSNAWKALDSSKQAPQIWYSSITQSESESSKRAQTKRRSMERK